jgi:crotonobetainyl-CoA:carnitine CoA-transferase CaiB-like acyl-CoA transferase
MLDDIRVLEISAPETMLAGRILADLGADVIVLEPPSGSPARRLEPFLDEIPGLERSLTWHALNRNKRAITLDLNSHDGRDLYATLAAKFDVVIEGAMTGGGSPLENLELPAKTIRCVVSAFGRSGPKSDYLASDLIVMASCGTPALTGDPDREPLFFNLPQSIMEAGADAAVATLASLAARDHDGLGQNAEVSARIAAMMSAMSIPLVIGSGNSEITRAAARGTIMGVRVPSIYECADGYVLVTVAAFGPAFGPMTQRLAKWAADEGHVAREIAEVNWSTFPADVAKKTSSPEQLDALVEGVRALCLRKTKNEIGSAARELGILASAVMDMKDIAESPQYRGRGLWTPVTIADGRRIDAPARFAQFSNFTIETRRPAPSLSEHTAEILESVLGLSRIEIQALFVHGVI